MIVIDIDIIKQVGITITETIHLYKIRDDTIQYDEFINYKRLEQLKLIKIVNDEGIEKYVIRTSGIKLLDEMLGKQEKAVKTAKKVSQRFVTNMVDDNIVEYREKWRGLKVSSMGDKKACRKKLIRWIEDNPEYTMDDVLKASEIYINNLNGDYRYLQRSDYFVYKHVGKEEVSNLSVFIEEINNKHVSHGWTSNLK